MYFIYEGLYLNSFLKYFIYLFLERVREGEREKNITVCLPLAGPYWGPGLQPRHVP